MPLVVPGRGAVCPHRHRPVNRDTAPDCAFRRPRRRQSDHAAGGSSVDGGIHTTPSRERTRSFRPRPAISLQPLARRPILAPVTTRSPRVGHPLPPGMGSDRRQPRQPWPQAAPARADLRRPCSPPAPRYTTRSLPSLAHAMSDVLSRQGLAWPTPARPIGASADSALDPLRAPDRRDSHGERAPQLTGDRHGPAAAHHRESQHAVHRHQRPPRRTRGRSPPRGRPRLIVQCVDEIDEMQRWLEGRE